MLDRTLLHSVRLGAVTLGFGTLIACTATKAPQVPEEAPELEADAPVADEAPAAAEQPEQEPPAAASADADDPLVEGQRIERVAFDAGSTSATIQGRITGQEFVDYKVGARKGQRMTVDLTTEHTANYFNVMEPGETSVATFIGSTSGGHYEGVLEETGDYTIRVYLMRSAGRRGEEARYTLKVAVADGPAAHGGDAKVAGTDFHATGKVPCTKGGGQPTTQCDFGVIREGGGTATVHVTHPDGTKRALYFEAGRATGADTSHAEMDGFAASREGDLTTVVVGKERYEIPDVVVMGD